MAVVVMVVVITLVVVMLLARLVLIPAAGLRRKELLGRAWQDVPGVLGGRRPGVPHGTRTVRRPGRAARDLASLVGTGLELGLLLGGAGLGRVGDAATGDLDFGQGLLFHSRSLLQ